MTDKIEPEELSGDPTEDQILELARKIKDREGLSLTDAMIKAEQKLTKPTADCEFTIKLTLKPKVAKFYRKEFEGHPDLTVEERLAIWVGMLLQQQRGQALVRHRAEMKVQEGRVVTVRHSAFLEQAPS